ncbi:hypothetical protein Glove_309g104 [Diversispora epigaea]|uniref:RanBD1 domain-containing protein n=1 Tax=Diversispora epigaea TaxID=1348612 RepID=A0A397HSB8_9GLOM|nr:hypothetical protein Glove_309g104 [Diversispora epigaea]
MNREISPNKVSASSLNKGVFGSGSKYAGNSLMESFACTSVSKKSIFDEQPIKNEEEDNENDKDKVEDEIPLETGTKILLQEIEGRDIDNNSNSNNNYNYNNKDNIFLILIYLVYTGEENETAWHSTRAKLYCMDGKTWKERGAGILRLNYPKNNETSPRIVMRADIIPKVILNVALFQGMHIERSQEKFIRLFAFEGDLLIHLAIKLPNSNSADDLYCGEVNW